MVLIDCAVILLEKLTLIVLESYGSGVAILRDIDRFNFRMRHVDTPFEHLRLAKDDVGGAGLISLRNVFESLEPDKVDGTGTVGEVGHQTLGPTLTNLVEADNLSDQLDIRHIAVDFGDTVKFGSVDVFIRVISKHIAHRCDVEFFLQQVSSVGSDSLDEFYVLVKRDGYLLFTINYLREDKKTRRQASSGIEPSTLDAVGTTTPPADVLSGYIRNDSHPMFYRATYGD